MLLKRKICAALTCLLLIFTFAAAPTSAKDKKVNEYKAIVKHLKTKYKAKKVNIPLMWLARFAVKVVRPAGVQSFSLTVFENLQFSNQTLDAEMRTAMKNSFGAEWSPVFLVRSRIGQQAYMYMREAGKSVKMALVTIDKNQAAVIRASFNPEKFVEFVSNPKIFGVSTGDDNGRIIEPKPAPEEVYVPKKKEKKETPE